MWDSVRTAFPEFTETFEGHVSFPYCDVKGLVTVGRGNLIDPVSTAAHLPWTINGQAASMQGILSGWNAVKARQDLKLRGGMAYLGVSALRLSDEAIDDLTTSKVLEMETHLKSRFGEVWDSLPSDAQLGVLSLAWACGPAFSFPKFESALLAKDFSTCAVECQMNVAGNPGLIPRNAANAQLFVNAANSVNSGMDPSILQYC